MQRNIFFNPVPLLILLFIFIIPEIPESSVNNVSWTTLDWNIECFEIDKAAHGDYYSSGEECTYTSQDGSNQYVIEEAEKQRIRGKLVLASNDLSDDGFNEPNIEQKQGKWNAIVYPPHCSCNTTKNILSDCCNSKDSEGNSKFNDEDLQGFHRKDELMIKSNNEQVSLQIVTAVHELFHGVGYAHLNPNGQLDNFRDIEFDWIREGGAEGFAWVWARKNGIDPTEFNEDGGIRPYDLPLFTGEIGTSSVHAYNTAYFWSYVAESTGNYKFMIPILNQDYSTPGGKTGGGVDQVHKGLIQAGLSSGLLNTYKNFVKEKLKAEKYFTKIHRKEVNKLDEEFKLETQGIPPIATYPGKFIVKPKEIEVEDRETKKFVLKIWVGESFAPYSHLYVNGEEVEKEIKIDVTEDFRKKDSILAHIRVANIDNTPSDSKFSDNQEIFAKLVEMECPLLPSGLTELVYKGTDAQGKDFVGMRYNLDITQEGADGQKGNMDVEVTTDFEKVIGAAELNFECTEEGVKLAGLEVGNIPGMGEQFSYLEMTVLTNTNIIPHKPEVGSELRDAEVLVHADATSELAGLFGMEISSSLTNRKVVKKETITVPAGSFECYRIDYDSKASIHFTGAAVFLNILKRKMERASQASNSIWVTEKYGWIKQEVKNNEGTSIYELISLKKG